MSVKDFVPDTVEDFGVVVLCEIELSTEGCHLFEHGVFLRIKNERKLICEFHASNLHEICHDWENSGQFQKWEAAAKNPAGFLICIDQDITVPILWQPTAVTSRIT